MKGFKQSLEKPLAQLFIEFSTQQKRNIYFFKLFSELHKNFSIISTQILQIITSFSQPYNHNQFHYQIQRSQILHKNLLQFIKLLVVTENLNYKNSMHFQFIKSLFLNFVSKASQSLSSQEFQIASLMLLIRNIQDLYLQSLLSSIDVVSQDTGNLGLCFLERLLLNIIQIIQGRKKGPEISFQFIQTLCHKSFELEKIQKITYTHPLDCLNFLKVTQYILYITRKFINFPNTNYEIYNQIMVKQFNKFDKCVDRDIDQDIVDALFGMMTEFCLTKEVVFIDKFQERVIEEEVQSNHKIYIAPFFDKVLNYSKRFGLSCPKVNKFWKTYISKRQNMLGRSISTFNSIEIVVLFSQNLYKLSTNIQQIQRKLQIVDNFLLINNFISRQLELKFISDLKSKLVYNPQTQKAKQIFFCSFQVLYSPLYTLNENNVFFQIIQDIKRICHRLQQINYDRSNLFNDCLQYLNMLPPMKILFLKCKNVILKHQCIFTLIYFLFFFLGNNNKALQKFIETICQELNSYMKSIPTSQKRTIVIINQRIEKLTQKCIKLLKKQCNRVQDISSHARSINNLITISLINSYANSMTSPHQTIMELINIVQIRSQYDQEIHYILSRLIKIGRCSGSNTLQQFKRMKKVIIQGQRILYLELIFDIAETNFLNEQITRQMLNSNHQINKLCQIKYYKQDLLRNIGYHIMIQSLNKNLDGIDQIAENLSWIVKQLGFQQNNYNKILDLLQRQRMSIIKFSQNIKHFAVSVQKFFRIMLAMIDCIHLSLEENNQSTNIEKAEISLCTAVQFYLYIQKFSQKLCAYYEAGQIQCLVDSIKQTIECSKLGKLSQMLTATKLLTCSYTQLQISKKLQYTRHNQQLINLKNIVEIMLNSNFQKDIYQHQYYDELFMLSVSQKLAMERSEEARELLENYGQRYA